MVWGFYIGMGCKADQYFPNEKDKYKNIFGFNYRCYLYDVMLFYLTDLEIYNDLFT